MTSNNTPTSPQVYCDSDEVKDLPSSTSGDVMGSADAPQRQSHSSNEFASPVPTHSQATSPVANRFGTEKPRVLLPAILLEYHDAGEDIRTRPGTIAAKRIQECLRQQAAKELRKTHSPDEKSQLYSEIRGHADEAAFLEDQLRTNFVPMHTPEQFLGPRIFFVSPLFRVRSTKETRQHHIELRLPVPVGKPEIRYTGPELRQSDGLVFLALLHMLRDVRVGLAVTLRPETVCRSLFGRYDGNARRQLREHIQRLQQGLLISKTFSVQLCQTFEYPKTGPWTVALDRHIVELFSVSPEVWFPLQERLSLPDGIATWLYGFISSQTKLIPMRLTRLKELCGSEASGKAFSNRTRDALKLLASLGTIDLGWSLKNGEVRWRKPLKH